MEWDSADSIIRAHLDPGERLLWSGQPVQGIRLRVHDIFLIPFSLFWTGFAVFWEVMALGIFFFDGNGGESSNNDAVPAIMGIIFPLFGLPFVLIGLYLLFGRFIVEARQRARTFYGVTNNRIIIASGRRSQKLKSLNLRTLSDLSMTENRSGGGVIAFGPTHPFATFWGGTSWPGSGPWGPPSFDLASDAAEVYRIIREAQKAY